MKSSRIGVCCTLLAIAIAPLGCESSSSSSGGVDAPDTGTFTPDGGDGGTVNPPVKSECVPPTKGPTMHGGGSTSNPENDVWTADGSPHILPYDTSIYHTVTLEPCAEVLIADSHTVTVRGKLISEGTATKRIHIGGKDAGKPFASIRLGGGSMRFAYSDIDGGGAQLNTAIYNAAMIDLQGDNLKPTQELLFVDHVTISGSASNGLMLREGAGFVTGSNALVIKGAAAHPLSIGPRSVNGIPAGSYTGNTKDSILLPTVSAGDTFSETATLHERGVPYLVGHATSGGDLRVDKIASVPDPTLTIEPGVVMRFKKGGLFQISVFSSLNPAHASLIAVGTAAKPIVFTSDEASPAPGDWVGLRWGNIPTSINKVDHVRVEYAGATTVSGSGSCLYPANPSNDAAIRINGSPPSQFITNTEVLGSPNHGIDRGWRSDDPVIDFLPTNKFTNVTRCQETYPPTAGNVCPPDPIPCPM